MLGLQQCLFIARWYKSETNQCVFAWLFPSFQAELNLLFTTNFILFLRKESSNLQISIPSFFFKKSLLFPLFSKMSKKSRPAKSFFKILAVSKNAGLLQTSGFSCTSSSFCVHLNLLAKGQRSVVLGQDMATVFMVTALICQHKRDKIEGLMTRDIFHLCFHFPPVLPFKVKTLFLCCLAIYGGWAAAWKRHLWVGEVLKGNAGENAVLHLPK